MIDRFIVESIGLRIDRLQHAGGNATYDGMRRDIAGHNRPGRHDRTPADADAIGDNSTGTDPDIILYDDAFGRNPLTAERYVWIRIHVIDSNNL